jgi:hypothetical protein
VSSRLDTLFDTLFDTLLASPVHPTPIRLAFQGP